MKKFILKGIALSLLTLGFVSCSSDDDDPWVEPEFINGAYILNSGKMNNNNANLGFYDFETDKYTSKVFFNQNNGTSIGDTGNDMVIYGSKMYILATNSNKIYITDLKGKLLKYSNGDDAIIDPKNDANEAAKPRFGTSHGGKVYVSLYSGHVARIDTTSMLIDGKVQVGAFPENLIAVNNNLYVSNAGYGNGETVSIVNLNQFKETSKLTVTLNPNGLASDNNGNIYIASFGKTWGGSNVMPQLQKYNPATSELTNLGTDIATKIVMNKDKNKLFIIKENWDNNGAPANDVTYYDIQKNEMVTDTYFKIPEGSNVNLKHAYTMSIDPNNGDIYISTSDYSNTGDMHIFSADGTYKKSFDTGGINPMGAYFVSRIY